jgi:hypothetical protein
MRKDEALKLFGLNNLTIEAEIRRIEESYDVDLGHRLRYQNALDRTYYPQFSERVRDEAASMAANYIIFYCLENSIRELIIKRLEEEHGPDWWDKVVPENVRRNAEGNHRREISAGVTPRSNDLIDYTNFGELGEIIKVTWDIFGEMFRDVRAVERILANLNTLRAPIAHCTPLAEDEVLRLHLGLRDWFRQME